MNTKQILYFTYTNLYAKWFSKLDKGYAVIVRKAIKKLEHGYTGQIKHLKKILYELKIDIGKGIRIYFIQDGNTIIVVLNGGDKSSQQKDINKSVELMEIYIELKEKGEVSKWLKK